VHVNITQANRVQGENSRFRNIVSTW